MKSTVSTVYESMEFVQAAKEIIVAEEAIHYRKTLVVTIVGSTELDGILSASIPNRLLEDWAIHRVPIQASWHYSMNILRTISYFLTQSQRV